MSARRAVDQKSASIVIVAVAAAVIVAMISTAIVGEGEQLHQIADADSSARRDFRLRRPDWEDCRGCDWRFSEGSSSSR
jgi:hypothetical protein